MMCMDRPFARHPAVAICHPCRRLELAAFPTIDPVPEALATMIPPTVDTAVVITVLLQPWHWQRHRQRLLHHHPTCHHRHPLPVMACLNPCTTVEECHPCREFLHHNSPCLRRHPWP